MIDVARIAHALEAHDRAGDWICLVVDHGWDAPGENVETFEAMLQRLSSAPRSSPWFDLLCTFVIGFNTGQTAPAGAWQHWAKAELGGELPTVHGRIDVRAALVAWLARRGRTLPALPSSTAP